MGNDKLIQRKVTPLDIRIMLSQYHRQKLRTMWNGSYSSYFDVENGVKQGAIASPTLFCIYIDELLLRLEKSGIGRWVGNHFLDALGYADDLVMICPMGDGL